MHTQNKIQQIDNVNFVIYTPTIVTDQITIQLNNVVCALSLSFSLSTLVDHSLHTNLYLHANRYISNLI